MPVTRELAGLIYGGKVRDRCFKKPTGGFCKIICDSNRMQTEGVAKLASRGKFSDFFVGSVSRKVTYPIVHRHFARNPNPTEKARICRRMEFCNSLEQHTFSGTIHCDHASALCRILTGVGAEATCLLSAHNNPVERHSNAPFTPWLTGPLIAPFGTVEPVGHFLIQPDLVFYKVYHLYLSLTADLESHSDRDFRTQKADFFRKNLGSFGLSENMCFQTDVEFFS